MGETRRAGRVVVVSRTWWTAGGEPAFVLRALAGALSRHAEVDVVAPGPPGTIPDGLFDVPGTGTADGRGEWPEPPSAPWDGEGSGRLPPLAAVVDQGDVAGARLVGHHLPGVPVLLVGAGGDPATQAPPGDGRDTVTGRQAARLRTTPRGIGLHVPVNPMAAVRPHNGFGFTGYVLVLTDRAPADGGAPDPPASPTALAAWIIARFPGRHVVVVEDAEASAWCNRSRWGSVHIDTRTDLWRLMAHAQVTVDLRPGPLLARECVESLRFGTPIVVPGGTAAAPLAEAGGGRCYDDVAGLLAGVESLADPALRAEASRRGRHEADTRHGDADRFVARVGEVLDELSPPQRTNPSDAP